MILTMIITVDQIQYGLLVLPKTSLDLRKWGNEKCRCIGYDGVPGSANVTIAGKESTAKWRLIHGGWFMVKLLGHSGWL